MSKFTTLITAALFSVTITGCATTSPEGVMAGSPAYAKKSAQQDQYDIYSVSIQGDKAAITGDISDESCMGNIANKTMATAKVRIMKAEAGTVGQPTDREVEVQLAKQCKAERLARAGLLSTP
jgi:outer membrane lipoprotein SlyB